FMRLINVPLTKFRGLVLIEPEVCAQRNFAILEDAGEVEVGGYIISGIAAEDDEQIDFATINIGNEFFNRVRVVDRVRIDWVGVEDGLPDVAKLRIDRMGQSVNHWRLIVASDYQARAFMKAEINKNRTKESPLHFRKQPHCRISDRSSLNSPPIFARRRAAYFHRNRTVNKCPCQC